jgi:1,4-alpha-glucan branching enzyme
MHELDGERAGFEWVDNGNFGSSVIGFLRKDRLGRPILWIFNFSAAVQSGYSVGCRAPGYWREIFNSDSFLYGGANVGNGGGVTASEGGPVHWPLSLNLTVPALGAVALKPEGEW